MASEQHVCEFCNCTNEANIYDEELEAWLCEEHDGGEGNSTGYCNQSCQLGYGCDGSC